MNKLLIAIASNDGKTFNKKHFGDSKMYSIYELSSLTTTFVGYQENITGKIDEEIHGASEKAKGVAQMLKQSGVQVNVSKIFGPNIKRIRKKFVCIQMNDDLIETSLIKLKKHFNEIFEEWEVGEERNILDYRISKQ